MIDEPQIKRDNLHINFQTIDGYQKVFNLVVCEREAGKSCELYYTKLYKAILKNRQVIVLKRHQNALNSSVIEEIQQIINKFLPPSKHIILKTRSGGYDSGKLYFNMICKDGDKLKTYKGGVILWIGAQDQYIKSLELEAKPINVLFDEYIINKESQERYLPNEMNKINILYGTLIRFIDVKHLKFYFCGNPYTRFTPFVLASGINSKLINSGALLVKNEYLIWCYKNKPELKEYLLKKNPMYRFDDTYRYFALEGRYIQDNITLIYEKQPKNFPLKFILCYNTYYIGFYKGENKEIKYYIKNVSKEYVKHVKAPKFCFQFSDVDRNLGVKLLNKFNSDFLEELSYYFSNGKIGFNKIETFYLIDELFVDFIKKI